MPTFANALDPKGDFIDVTMSPTTIKTVLVRLSQSIPVNHKYTLCVNATAVDETGTPVNVTMYAKTWEKVEIGQTYICHHLQMSIKLPAFSQHKNPSLRTIPETSFLKTFPF